MKNYKVINTKKPFINGEYPTGGYIVYSSDNNIERYIDNAPDFESVANFIKMASRNKTITVEFSSNDVEWNQKIRNF